MVRVKGSVSVRWRGCRGRRRVSRENVPATRFAAAENGLGADLDGSLLDRSAADDKDEVEAEWWMGGRKWERVALAGASHRGWVSGVSTSGASGR